MNIFHAHFSKHFERMWIYFIIETCVGNFFIYSTMGCWWTNCNNSILFVLQYNRTFIKIPIPYLNISNVNPYYCKNVMNVTLLCWKSLFILACERDNEFGFEQIVVFPCRLQWAHLLVTWCDSTYVCRWKQIYFTLEKVNILFTVFGQSRTECARFQGYFTWAVKFSIVYLL